MSELAVEHGQVRQRVWALAGPMILSNLSVPLLGMVDTAVVGHLDSPVYLGAVAVGATVFSFLFWGFGFLRMGTTGLAAQAHGEADAGELRAVLGRALLIGGALALLLLLLQWPLGELAWWAMDASRAVEASARAYFEVRIWSAPAVLAKYALIGWFLGMQNARAPLALLVTVNALNILLDLLFVLGLGWGVPGVALATVLAEYAGLLLGLWLVHRLLRGYPGRWSLAAIVDPARLRRLLTVNRHIFVRTLCLMFSFAFFTAQGARLGTTVLAANAVLLNLQNFMAYGLDGFAHAAEALVGRAIGARDCGLLEAVLRVTRNWSLGVAALFAAIYAVAGQGIVALLTDLESVRGAAALYLPWLVLSPLVSVWSYWYDGIFIGATRSAAMQWTMLFATGVVFLPVWYLTRPWGNHGLWFALIAFMGARGVAQAWVSRRLGREGLLRTQP